VQLKRFDDRGARAADFAHEFAVRCPKCGERASVSMRPQGWTRPRVSCAGCGYSATTRRGEIRGPAVGLAKGRCRNCGRWIERHYAGTAHEHAARLRCAGCGAISTASIAWRRTQRATPSDPHFGLPLWFVGTIKGEVFWAYNAAHLEFIRNYVAAELRIRTPNMNASLASRLPAFLLDRRNRRTVLEKILQLQKESLS
jgi:hypothetical protein